MHQHAKSLIVMAVAAVLMGYVVGLASYVDTQYVKRLDGLQRDLRQYDAEQKELTQQAVILDSARLTLIEQIAQEREKMGALEAALETQAPLPGHFAASGGITRQAEALSTSPDTGRINRLVDRLVELRSQSPGTGAPKVTGASGTETESTSTARVTSASATSETAHTTPTSLAKGAQSGPTTTTIVTSASQTETTLPPTTTTMGPSTPTLPQPTTTTQVTSASQTTTTLRPTTTTIRQTPTTTTLKPTTTTSVTTTTSATTTLRTTTSTAQPTTTTVKLTSASQAAP
jgi:hypothetical protein